jgi:hypothetical protein
MTAGDRAHVWLLPAMFLAHVAEELAGGFPAWACAHFGRITTTRFFLLSHVPLVAGAFGAAWLGARGGRAGAFVAMTVLAVLVGNGAFHAVATLALRQYSPGVITGTVLYAPLAVLVARRTLAGGDLDARGCATAAVVGLALSLVIVASLYLDVTIV